MKRRSSYALPGPLAAPLLCALWAPAVAAQARPAQPAAEAPEVVEARAAYDQGIAAHRAGRFDEAATHFRRALERRPEAATLAALARALQDGQHPAEAADAWERYLREQPEPARQNLTRAEVENSLRTLRAQVAAQPAPASAQPASAQPSSAQPAAAQPAAPVEGAPAAAMPVPPPAPPPESAPPVAPPAAAEAPPPAEEPSTSRPIPAGVWAAGAVTVAGVVSGTVLGLVTLGQLSDYNAHPSTELRDRGQSLAQAADLCFGAAILSAAVGVVVYFAERPLRRPAAAPAAPAAPAAAPSVARLRRSLEGVRAYPAPLGLTLTF